MDPKFWQERWQRAEIGFHQSSPNNLLLKYWPQLNIPNGALVFVPLCGKSLDMLWLTERGHDVLGIEVSELAIDDFFKACNLTPTCQQKGSFNVKQSGSYELWCGDYFAFPPEAARNVTAVYDRAALIAMPPSLQQAYADKLADLTPAGVPVLLISLNYDPSQMDGPPFAIPPPEIKRLFEAAFDVTCLETRDGLPKSENLKKRGLKHLEEAVYVLKRH